MPVGTVPYSPRWALSPIPLFISDRRDSSADGLLIAGDGPQRSELEELAKDLSISERVTFLGTRSDMQDIYPAMDALALI